jgi:hypothetical protein
VIADRAANNYEKVLKIGDLAPFKGVLVPEDGYRFYQMDVKALEACKTKLDSSGNCPPCEPELFSAKQLMFFIGGLVVGGLVVDQIK